VPSGGRGAPRQVSLDVAQARVVVGAALVLLAALAVGSVAALGGIGARGERDALRVENAELSDRLATLSGELDKLEPVVRRMRVYDEQLRSLQARGELLGFGALDDEAWSARQDWIDGVVGSPSAVAATPEARLALVLEDLGATDLDRLEGNIETWLDIDGALPALWPVEGVVSSGFGSRLNPFGKRSWKFHAGVDIAAARGTEIVATGDGLVTFAGWASGNGLMVEVDHGHGIATRYCHASQIVVAVGQEVIAGETIARVGSTGHSTGAHLHYELAFDGERVDPVGYLPG
jgi:murein DD-endopeptidase MepM/ murein hydrolase activator NlpD